MKITLEQLRTLIREAVEETHHDKMYSADELLRAIDLSSDDEDEEIIEPDAEEDYEDEERVGEFNFLRGPRGPVREGTVRLIYTNHGILTEERVRELKECGVHMEECGVAGEMAGPSMRMGAGYMGDEPVVIVQEDVLEEYDTSIVSTGGSAPGPQATGSAPNGPAGAPSPSGAAVTKESFNRRAERLLEAWMEEELHGDQDKLDINKNGKLDKFDFMALRNKAKPGSTDMNEWYAQDTNDEYYTQRGNEGPRESEADRKKREAAEKEREADSWEGLNPYTGYDINR